MTIMRAFLIALLLLIATLSLHAQSRAVGEQLGFSGPVRVIRIEAVRTDANGLTGPRVPVSNEAFDERGNVLHHTVFNPDGSLKWTADWGHAYDTQGREIKTYYYNEQGVLTSTGVSVYDNKGRRTETTLINPNGSINHIRAYFYDENGNNVREAHRNENGSARNVINRKYDADGRMTEEIFIDGEGDLHHRNVLTYDARGNRTGWTLFQSNGTVIQMVRRILSYDERGNVKEALNYLSDNSIGSRETFSYEFDSRGNWIKRNTSREVLREGRSQTESEVTYRTITYF